MTTAGLTQAEASARLARDGLNDLPARERHSVVRIIGEVIREPMFALLLVAALLYAMIGDRMEALVLAGFATISVSIAIVQRGRSERVMDALRDLTSPRALVIRDGESRRIPGREVVVGDVLVLHEGDRVAADALLVRGEGLHVDESLLTGESASVRKRPCSEGTAQAAVPGGDDLPHVFSGTLIVRGNGIAVVTATGARSEIGKIGHAVATMETEPPRLQVETRRLVLSFATVSLLLSVLAVVLYGLLRGNWLEAVLGGIALGMSMLPEEFPLVLTVYMVMGAWRLSRSKVLTRRATAIETLGSATVLCTDKTGTLTQNRMSVVSLLAAGEGWKQGESTARIEQSESLAQLLECAVAASDPATHDPMDRAICDLAAMLQARVPQASRDPAREYPLTPDLLAVTRVWQSATSASYFVAAKGAPEAIARLCRLDSPALEALREQVDALAGAGTRVLGVAKAQIPADGGFPAASTDIPMQLVGLLGFADPLRETVPDAVRECRAAGIRVVMITGDYPLTAQEIARQAGIGAGALLSGEELDRTDDQALRERIRDVSVCARITPRQKLRIVNALKASGEIVAMTGDGVNDAPALKAAHIGIAMGGRGTDVAREASSIVLLDDDFGSIVRAIRLGRRIYDNLRKAMGYILAIHVPIAGLALLPIVLGEPLLLTPMLIAFLELIIDPSCSVVLEAEKEEHDVMSRPPRDPHGALLSRPIVIWSLAQGVLAFLLAAAVFLFAVHRELPEAQVRAISLLALVCVNVSLIFVNRRFSASLRSALGRPNASLWWGLGLAAAALTAMLGVPSMRGFFDLGPLRAGEIVLCLLMGIGLLLALETGKALWFSRLLKS